MRWPKLLFLFSVACVPDPDGASVGGRAQSLVPSALRPGAIAAETALLSLILTPDGAARFAEVQRRPIAYSASKQTNNSSAGDHVVEVSVAGQVLARVPLRIGSARDPAGPAQSAWAGGATIVRAPSFGPETRFALRSTAHPDERILAEIGVEE